MKNIPLAGESRHYVKENYYPALDGLRGLAILLIIMYHNFGYLKISQPTWISLDLFFVLSGFLITGILLEKRNSLNFLRNFYARRVLRIFPIYYLSIVLFLFILPGFVPFRFSLNYFIENQQWFWLEVQNWLFILKSHGNNNYLNHFWSLALEEQFYLISPFIILLFKSLQKIISFLLSALLLLMLLRLLTWFLHFEDISYINLYAFTRIDGLCVGSLLAIFKYQGNFKVNGFNKTLFYLFLTLILIVFPVFKIALHLELPYRACSLYPVIALFWGYTVWSCVRSDTLIFRAFNTRVLIFFGRISYGLYIFHWPISRLLGVGILTKSDRHDILQYNLLLSAISTIIAIGLATLSYYTFERYFLGLKKYFI